MTALHNIKTHRVLEVRKFTKTLCGRPLKYVGLGLYFSTRSALQIKATSTGSVRDFNCAHCRRVWRRITSGA